MAAPAEPEGVCVIPDAGKKCIKLKINGYFRLPRSAGSPGPRRQQSDDIPAGELETDVFEAFKGRTALVFANKKSFIEAFADFARREAERRGLPPRYFAFTMVLCQKKNGRKLRKSKSSHPTATFCSSTLELGIDVGNVGIVGQIGPPWSVNSLVHRMGRSGRKEDEPS